MSIWRERAASMIWRVILAHPGASEAALRAAIRASYPFGPRRYWPYKVWREEVECALRRLFPRPRLVQGGLFDPPAEE
jgi:hypothetical protein